MGGRLEVMETLVAPQTYHPRGAASSLAAMAPPPSMGVLQRTLAAIRRRKGLGSAAGPGQIHAASIILPSFACPGKLPVIAGTTIPICTRNDAAVVEVVAQAVRS